ncbi:EAL domain-containing protein, partial [Alicyclobacillus cycloheptanicus]|uniref:EAL domain-containing protein n=1 Tax=Alicyclobacillus cycloheptanicus TaxID=1457 RepID=UPI0027D7D738
PATWGRAPAGRRPRPPPPPKHPFNTLNYIDVTNSITEILEKGSIEMVYQPIVDHTKRKVYAYEALSRPVYRGRFIPPDVWFQAAYERNQSVSVDVLALTSAVSNVTSIPHETNPMLLFVNVMPSSLMERDFRRKLEKIFTDGLCEPKHLVLEVVEYISYDPPALFKCLEPIRSLGVRIALDDVGKGNTSLSTLEELKPDFIKIDRSLTRDVALSSSKQRLLRELTQVMESGDFVIAEGVERWEDVIAVQAAGIHLSQGYYWSRPMPAHELTLLAIQIEIERMALFEIASEKKGVLTDEAVIRKSQELDMLINSLCRNGNGTTRIPPDSF